MSAFTGFPRETPGYLSALGENNNKDWFGAHRTEYESFYMAPAKSFVTAIGDRIKGFAPGITAIPTVNKSIFRINNDTRFAKDKPPYKDHIDLGFYHGEDRKSGCSSFFFRLSADEICIGAGVHRFEPRDLEQYRSALTRNESAASIHSAISALTDDGYEIGGEHYKRVPKGLEAQSENPFAKFNALNAFRISPMPDSVHSPGFVDWCEPYFKRLLPLHEWLLGNIRDR